METELRGLIEQEIDQLIIPETLERLVVWFKAMFPIKSMEDGLFGFVVGAVFSRFLTIAAVGTQGLPNDVQIKEFMELIERRTMEIRGKIKLAINK